MTREQIFHDYYLPLLKGVPGFQNFPVGVQAAMLSGAYNFGVGSVASKKGIAGSTATRFHIAACQVQRQGDAAKLAADNALRANDKALATKNQTQADRLYVAAAGEYRKGCEAQTAFNKAGGITVDGLVKRSEMGDAQRKAEAEICVSGLPL
jgi:GH24 family phage-related lysozyme (muramidase)